VTTLLEARTTPSTSQASTTSTSKVKKDTTPVTAAQIAYAADLAFVGAGQVERIDLLGQTWYLNRIFNGGSGRYVGAGGQCIFMVVSPTILFGPDNCASVDLLIDGWVRFPKTVVVSATPGVTNPPTPQFTTNPALSGGTATTVVLQLTAPQPTLPLSTPVVAPPASQRVAPAVRVVADSGAFGGSILYSFPNTTGAVGYEVTAAGLGAIHPNPIPLSYLAEYSPLLFRTKSAPVGSYRVSIRLLYSDGTYGPSGVSNTCTIALLPNTQFGGVITC
jgi:hypothetical protein